MPGIQDEVNIRLRAVLALAAWDQVATSPVSKLNSVCFSAISNGVFGRTTGCPGFILEMLKDCTCKVVHLC